VLLWMGIAACSGRWLLHWMVIGVAVMVVMMWVKLLRLVMMQQVAAGQGCRPRPTTSQPSCCWWSKCL
jgi:hypothetical protein